MNQLGNGLHEAERHAEALTVREAELATQRRVGETERNILVAQSNLASTYQALGRLDEALSLRQEGYSGRLELSGEEHEHTIHAASNYATSLLGLKRFEEAKSLFRKVIPVARRILGETHEITLTMRKIYARALFEDAGATLGDLREAVTTLEDSERIARRVLGPANPATGGIEIFLRNSRAALAARERSPTSNDA
jgi:tetratricopeptide (TPR) repeat protein